MSIICSQDSAVVASSPREIIPQSSLYFSAMSTLRPPPMQLLPAFDAAARLLSFSKAAEELHITKGAVSQQIKQLEDHLGIPLFQRHPRRVELTSAGQHFATVTAQIMALYRRGHAEFLHSFTKPTLRLSVTPLVAHRYLIPQLPAFQAACPNVTISLSASMGFVDFDEGSVDAAIRVGSGTWPGLESWPLCECAVVLLAAPSLLARHPVHQLDDLRHHTLIHLDHPMSDWDTVARLVQVPKVPRKDVLVLDSDLATLRAAEQGLGVAVCALPVRDGSTGPLLPSQVIQILPAVTLRLQAYFVFRPNVSKGSLLKATFELLRSQLGSTADTNG